jgi:hypothetical protein
LTGFNDLKILAGYPATNYLIPFAF